MYNNRSKGFTLTELLVVIAIIGILSAVVLASLNTARQKGNDAAIQSNLNTIQTQAEIYYGDNSNTYGGADSTGDCGASGTMFVGNTTISSALAQAKTANGNVALKCYVATGGTAYAVASQLSTSASTYWCVDSTGFAGKRTGVLSSSACPSS
jgi:prepilin-type N-terminal cleavage/methylation domain-containing protein